VGSLWRKRWGNYGSNTYARRHPFGLDSFFQFAECGHHQLSITNIGLTGTNPGDFSQTNNCGSSVLAGANCAIGVTFAPMAAGARSASVSITDDAGGSPQTVNLSGTGAAVSTPTGTYPVVVNAVGGNIAHSLTVNVTVQ
jgi:hypothetical protein